MKLKDMAIGAGLQCFKKKVAMAIELIASIDQPIAVSVSGGKDSQVCLDLALRAKSKKDVYPVFFDCGTQLKSTYIALDELESYYSIKINRIKTEPQLVDMLKAGNYWGYTGGEDKKTFNFMDILVTKPAIKHMIDHKLEYSVIGLREEESSGRKKRGQVFGDIFQKKDGYHYCYPISKWKVEDIWCYIMSRELPYNKAYEVLLRLGVPLKDQRVGCYFGSAGNTIGRFVYLKYLDIGQWNRYIKDFPKLAFYS